MTLWAGFCPLALLFTMCSQRATFLPIFMTPHCERQKLLTCVCSMEFNIQVSPIITTPISILSKQVHRSSTTSGTHSAVLHKRWGPPARSDPRNREWESVVVGGQVYEEASRRGWSWTARVESGQAGNRISNAEGRLVGHGPDEAERSEPHRVVHRQTNRTKGQESHA